MSTIIYNDENIHLLPGPLSVYGSPGALPRRTIYGSAEAAAHGLVAAEDELTPVPEADWKEVIADCHARKIFPMYHREAAGDALEQKPSQGRLNYCWAWSMRACLENTRAVENQDPVKLAPVSLGWLVNRRNAGYYLDATIKAAQERGICSTAFVPDQYDISTRSFKAGWEQDALSYRTSEWWDTNRDVGVKAFIGQCLAILRTGRPLYQAHNWESHAMCGFGMEWDERQQNNIVWVEFNSWADGLRRMAGSRGIPDEAYGVRSTSLARA